ncbi:MAG: glycosyltransferase family 2 protein [Thiomonas sp.]
MQATRAADVLASVAIPAYNAQAMLDETLESVLTQTHPQLDIIVVDGCSTDGTWALLQRYGARIRAIRQDNAGIGAARNTSIQAARDDFIVLLDADDLCEPDRIESQLAYLRAHPDILLCSSDFSSFDARGLLQESAIGSYYHRCSPALGGVRARYPRAAAFELAEAIQRGHMPTHSDVYSGNVYEQLAQGNFIHPPMVMFRRHALTLAGGSDAAVRIACEWEWFVRVARAGAVAYLDLPLLRYRRSVSQISSSVAMSLDSLRVTHKIHEPDSTLRTRYPATVSRQLGGPHRLQAAYALSETEPWQALKLVVASVFAYRVLRMLTFRMFVKIIMPTSGPSSLRGLRKRLPANS